jgi:hypothetical protein
LRGESAGMDEQVRRLAEQLLATGFHKLSERERRVITGVAKRTQISRDGEAQLCRWETLTNVIPSPRFTMTDGVINIDADLLAPKLGLSVEVLKAEMLRGYVYSVTEQGIDSDAGRPAPHFPLSRPVLVRGGRPRGHTRRGPGDRQHPRALNDGCNGVLAGAPPRRIRTGHMTASADMGTSRRF